jgi:hypothetical protein
MLVSCVDIGSTWAIMAKPSTGSQPTHPFSFKDGQRSGLVVSFITFFHKHVYAPNHHHPTDHNAQESLGGFMDSQWLARVVDVLMTNRIGLGRDTF